MVASHCSRGGLNYASMADVIVQKLNIIITQPKLPKWHWINYYRWV